MISMLCTWPCFAITGIYSQLRAGFFSKIHSKRLRYTYFDDNSKTKHLKRLQHTPSILAIVFYRKFGSDKPTNGWTNEGRTCLSRGCVRLWKRRPSALVRPRHFKRFFLLAKLDFVVISTLFLCSFSCFLWGELLSRSSPSPFLFPLPTFDRED